MKKLLFIITILSTFLGYSQSSIGGSGAQQNLGGGFGNIDAFGYSVKSLNRIPQTDGTFYLFDKWENNCVIQTMDNQKIRIKNINLNIERHTFESQIDGDSIFAFNFNNIDKFIINNRVYKNFYWNDDIKVYEIVFENEDFQILKGFRVLFVQASVNPMLKRGRDKYVRKEAYYLRKDNKISTFKLKKKKILKLVNGDVEKANEIENYANNNGLSFNKETDVIKILDYSAKN